MSTASSTKRSMPTSRPSADCSRWRPGTASRPRRRPTSGSRTTATTSTCRRGVATRRRPTSGSPTSCAATPTSCGRTTISASVFDTFYDRRSGFMFYTNPLGALADYSIVDEGAPNTDWNPVWGSATGRFEGGWTVEMAIPFKTLRYTLGHEPGVGRSVPPIDPAQERVDLSDAAAAAARRPAGDSIASRWAARWSGSTFRPPAGISSSSRTPLGEATPIGCAPRRSVERLGWRCRRRREVRRHRQPDGRLHPQHRLRPGRDRRAAGEPDALQPVLSREARVLPRGPRRVRLRARRRLGRRQTRAVAGPPITPYLFYSRRIGLNGDRVMPIDAGGRLTGKVGEYGIGVMNIQTGDERGVGDAGHQLHGASASSATSCGAAPSARSFTNRSESTRRTRWNESGLRRRRGASRSTERQSERLLRPHRDDRNLGRRRELSGQVRLRGRPLRRAGGVSEGRRRLQSRGRLSAPRRLHAVVRLAALQPASRPTCAAVRKFSFEGEPRVHRERRRRARDAQQTGRFNTEFDNSDQFTVEVNANYDLLVVPFQRRRAASCMPVGGYDFSDVMVSLRRAASSAACRGRCRCSAGSSTTATSRRVGDSAAAASR